MRKLTAAVIAAGAISLATISASAQPYPTKLLPGWRYPCSFCMYTFRGGAPYPRGGYNAPGTVIRASCSGPACVRTKRRARH
jgi:rubredoxin